MTAVQGDLGVTRRRVIPDDSRSSGYIHQALYPDADTWYTVGHYPTRRGATSAMRFCASLGDALEDWHNATEPTKET